MDDAISAADANRSFSSLLRCVREGHSVVVTSHGKPIARIVPIERAGRRRVLGLDAGQISIRADFDDAVDPETML